MAESEVPDYKHITLELCCCGLPWDRGNVLADSACMFQHVLV